MEEAQYPRLPEIYHATDETIQAAAEQHAEATRAAAAGPVAQAASSERRRFEVTEMSVDPEVLQTARRLAGGDIGRIVFRNGAAIVCNSRHHAKLVRENEAFGEQQ